MQFDDSTDRGQSIFYVCSAILALAAFLFVFALLAKHSYQTDRIALLAKLHDIEGTVNYNKQTLDARTPIIKKLVDNVTTLTGKENATEKKIHRLTATVPRGKKK